jgi:hypothetical protein
MQRWGVLGGEHQVLWRFGTAFSEYVAEVGTPIVATCDVDLGSPSLGWVYQCRTHGIGWSERIVSLNGWQTMDRCPVSRLEEWRFRMWEMTA